MSTPPLFRVQFPVSVTAICISMPLSLSMTSSLQMYKDLFYAKQKTKLPPTNETLQWSGFPFIFLPISPPSPPTPPQLPLLLHSPTPFSSVSCLMPHTETTLPSITKDFLTVKPNCLSDFIIHDLCWQPKLDNGPSFQSCCAPAHGALTAEPCLLCPFHYYWASHISFSSSSN